MTISSELSSEQIRAHIDFAQTHIIQENITFKMDTDPRYKVSFREADYITPESGLRAGAVRVNTHLHKGYSPNLFGIRMMALYDSHHNKFQSRPMQRIPCSDGSSLVVMDATVVTGDERDRVEFQNNGYCDLRDSEGPAAAFRKAIGEMSLSSKHTWQHTITLDKDRVEKFVYDKINPINKYFDEMGFKHRRTSFRIPKRDKVKLSFSDAHKIKVNARRADRL